MALVRSKGYVQLRRGLFEHVQNGRISFNEASLYVAIIAHADPATGLCYGSAGLYAALYGLSDRTCRDALEKLESKRYLKRFATPGKHGSYPILINKFLCSDGAAKGMYVNADKTENCERIVYESREESVEQDVEDGVEESAGKYIENRNKRNSSRAAKTREADPRHQGFKSALLSYWQSKNPGVEMPWDGSEGKQLARWLSSSPQTTLAQFEQYLQNRLKSDVNHAERPSRWINSITSFASGPLDRFGRLLAANAGKPAHSEYPLGFFDDPRPQEARHV